MGAVVEPVWVAHWYRLHWRPNGRYTVPAGATETLAVPGNARRQVVSRAGVNVLDQAVSSLASLGLWVVVARAVDSTALGAFALSYTLYGFLIGVCRAVTTLPLGVRFSSSNPLDFRAAAREATGTGIVVGLVSGLTLALAGIAIPGQVGRSLVAMGVVMPGVLLLDTWRGVFVAGGEPAKALVDDVLWAVLQFAALGWLVAKGTSSAPPLVLGWGLAGTAAGLYGIVQMGAFPQVSATRRWLVTQWDQAGFFLAEWVTLLGSTQLALVLIAVLGEVSDIAALRGAQTLLGPLNVISMSVMGFAVPEIARHPKLTGHDRRRVAWVISALLVGVDLAWGAVLVVLPDSVGDQVLGQSWPLARAVLPATVAGACALVACTGPVVILRAAGKIKQTFRISVVTSMLQLPLGLLGLKLDGAAGAAAGFAIASVVGVPLLAVAVARATAEGAEPEPAADRFERAAPATVRTSPATTGQLAARR